MSPPADLHQVAIYSREGCHLCEEAKHLVERLSTEFAIEFSEIDITSDHQLYLRYKDVIPVVVVDGATEIVSRVSEFRLRRALRKASSG